MSHYPQYLKIVMLFSVISSYAAILNELLSRSTYIAQLMQMCNVVPFSGKGWQHPHSDKLLIRDPTNWGCRINWNSTNPLIIYLAKGIMLRHLPIMPGKYVCYHL